MSSEYQREYLVRLPLPLAQLYDRAYNSKDPRARYDNTFYLFEALIKLATAPAIACYLHEVGQGAPRSKSLDRVLAQLALPSLGQWVGMLRALSRHFGQRPDASSHPLGHLWDQLAKVRRDRPALLALYRRIKHGADGEPAGDQSCSVLNLFDALVQYRNDVIGHGGPRFDSFFTSEMGPLLFPATNEILAEGTFDPLGPRGSRLVYINSELRQLDEDRVEVGLRELIGKDGERAAPLTLGRTEAATLAGRVAVVWPGWPVPLRLDPLLLYREGERSSDMLFLNRDLNGRHVRYLNYSTGRTERDRSTVPAMAALLTRVTGHAVSEAQLEALAEQSRANTPSVESLFGPVEPVSRVLGGYEILAEIGRGGMGVVFLARQLSLGRLVALKMLPADLAGDEVALSRFRRELRLLARCEHPNIVMILDSGMMPDGQLYYAMEYIPGCNLDQVWRELSGSKQSANASTLGGSSWRQAIHSASRKAREQANRRTQPAGSDAKSPDPPVPTLPPLPDLPSVRDDPGGNTRRVVKLVRDAARALQAIHDQGIVHRDVKPANLMLTPDGSRVVLMDFGLAKGQSLDLTSTHSGGLLGTLRYAAPEQLAAARMKVGPTADVRGLGVVLWELLTRRRLFAESEDEVDLTERIFHQDVPRLRTIDPAIERDLEAIVARATERRAADRIASAGQLAEYLQLYRDEQPLPIRPPSVGELFRRWVREHRQLVTSVAVAAFLMIATVVTAFFLITASRNHAVRLAEANGKLAIRNGKLLKETETLASERAVALEEEARQRQRVEWQVYRSQIETAFRALRENQASLAETALDACRWDFRGWEYYHARRRLESARLVIDRPGRFLNALSFSPDSKSLAIACGDHFVVYDAITGAALWRSAAHGGMITALAWAPDGSFVVSVARDTRARLWDSAGNVLTFTGHKAEVGSLAVSPDGKAVATGDTSGIVLVWSPQTLKELHRYQDHNGSVILVAFTGGVEHRPAADHKLLSLGKDRKLVCRDLTTGQAKTETTPADFQAAAFSRSDDLIAGVSSAGGKSQIHWKTLGAGNWTHPGEIAGEVSQVALIRWPELVAPSWSPGSITHLLALGTNDDIRFLDLTVETTRRLSLGVALPLRLLCFTCSPDGRTVAASVGWELAPGRVKVWDFRKDAELLALRESSSKSMHAVDAVFTRDGSRVVIGRTGSYMAGNRGAGRVFIQSVNDIKETRFINISSELGSIALTPDAKSLACGYVGGKAMLWDLSNGKELRALAEHKEGVTALAFSPDGGVVVSGGEDSLIRMTDPSSGANLATLKGHTMPIRALAFRPDGKVIASGGVDATVRLWDADTGAEKANLRGHGSTVSTLAFSPDGRFLVSGSADATVRLWDVSSSKQVWMARETTGRRLAELPGSSDPRQILQLVFTPDGKRVVSLAGNYLPPESTIRFWDAATGQLAWTIDDGWKGTTLALSRDGRMLLSCAFATSAMAVWEAADPGSIEPRLLRGQTLEVRATAFSPDDRLIACGSDDRSLVLYSAASGQSESNIALGAPCVCLTFHPTRNQLAYNADERRVALRELGAHDAFRSLDHPDEVCALAYSPNGSVLATGCKDKKARVWDVATGTELAAFDDHEERVSCVDFTPDGGTLVTGSWDGKVRLWDLGAQTLRTRLDLNDEGVSCVAVSADGRFVIAGGLDGVARIWDLRDGRQSASLKPHEEAVTALIVLSDGTAMSAGADGYLNRWDVLTGRSIRTTRIGGEGVLSLSLSADGKQFVAGCKDGVARVGNFQISVDPRLR